ncbi:MAG: hypothetical protein JWM49_2532 [Microbacteriaceae bacterium]|nr:hypothetical protein [Microbacteriaceae bacterium]
MERENDRLRELMSTSRIETTNEDAAAASNRSLIYSIIWQQGPVSRSDLVRKTSLTKSTVSSHVDDLIDSGFIKENGLRQSSSTGGRRAVLLEVNPESHIVAGIHIGVRQTTVVLADAQGNEVDSVTKRTSQKTPTSALQETATTVRTLLSRTKIPFSRLAAVGVALPGVVQPDTGTCIIAPNLGWRDIPVADVLQSELNVPVFVNNTTQAMAVAESQYVGARGESPDLALLYVGTGIGAAVVDNGRLFRGRSGYAGEIGHVGVGSGILCSCGKVGCLETLVSGPAIARRSQEAGFEGSLDGQASTELIGRAAISGDRAARKLLDDVGRDLGHAAAWLLQIAGPDTLVIGGGVSALGNLIMEPLRAGLRESAMAAVADTVTVRRSYLDSRAKLRGATLTALQQVDEPRRGLLAR